MPIEEYDQVFERHDFMLTQKEDIELSKEKLIEVIDELETAMSEQFIENFAQINQNFKEVFSALFVGGEAELDLETDDPLTAGIIIKAQPPGKRLQNMSLLSGGERSLTAIALLLAIFRLRPAPFCAWKATVQEDADTVLELAGARAELEGFFDAIESVLSDVESSPNDAVSASVRGELESLVARATQLVHDIAGKYRLHQGLPGKGETDSVCGGSVELEGPLPDERSWVELLASARESLALDGPWKTSNPRSAGACRRRFAGCRAGARRGKADIDAVGRRRVPHRSGISCFGGLGAE